MNRFEIIDIVPRFDGFFLTGRCLCKSFRATLYLLNGSIFTDRSLGDLPLTSTVRVYNLEIKFEHFMEGEEEGAGPVILH